MLMLALFAPENVVGTGDTLEVAALLGVSDSLRLVVPSKSSGR